jgi:glycine C-acetyltransferase
LCSLYTLQIHKVQLSQYFAARMLDEGIYVVGFYYPVVPNGQARIRVQLSAAHEKAHLDKAIAAFIKVGKTLGVL